MLNHDFIPEDTASKLAGVSPTTLARFVEAGYLRVLSDAPGLNNYSKSEICKLFAVDDCSVPNTEPVTQSSLRVSKEIVDSEEKTYDADEVIERENEPLHWAEAVESEASAEKTEKEVTRLRNITEVQDKILEIREREIEDLRKERDWLRTRIERLEEKSERDQLLLLAETQTIRKLVNLTHQKKPSNLRLALEWFGFVAPDRSAQIHSSSSKAIIEKD